MLRWGEARVSHRLRRPQRGRLVRVHVPPVRLPRGLVLNLLPRVLERGGGAALPTGLLAPRNLPRPRVDISRACTTVVPASASRAAAESDGPRSRRPTRRSARRVDMF